MIAIRKLVLGGIAVCGRPCRVVGNRARQSGQPHRQRVRDDGHQQGRQDFGRRACGRRQVDVREDGQQQGWQGDCCGDEGGHKAVTGHAATKSDMSAADKIKAVDSDGDGILTAEEHVTGSMLMFQKWMPTGRFPVEGRVGRRPCQHDEESLRSNFLEHRLVQAALSSDPGARLAVVLANAGPFFRASTRPVYNRSQRFVLQNRAPHSRGRREN